jgi:pSer/pThr/pTyr-binding forkhead associated (FHA) protein
VTSVRVVWTDPSTGEPEERIAPLPATLGSAETNAISLASSLVHPRHAALTLETIGLVVHAEGGAPVLLDGKPVRQAYVPSGSTLGLGPFSLVVSLHADQAQPAAPRRPATIALAVYDGDAAPGPPAAAFVPPQAVTAYTPPPATYGAPAAAYTPAPPTYATPPAAPPATTGPWPPAAFSAARVPVEALAGTGLPIAAVDYLTIGAGLGSFAFVDTLLSAGVRPDQIVALGVDREPHARYRRLCHHSQIPDHERLRSNSDATMDNIWGFPGYAMREVFRELGRFHPFRAAGVAWKIFGEPTLAETFTPIADDVYRGIAREADRIGWARISRYGRVRSIRLTNDGRYVIAYSAGAGVHALLVARNVHLATGYPALQFLPDLQRYRETTGDFQSVVNAYENHDHVYQALAQGGGVVVMRGRGIVSSRLLQRIAEMRRQNRNITVVHLMRTPIAAGHKYGLARREVHNHFELQPFNWPKACVGGDLRPRLAKASPEQRKRLLSDWGGVTTARRSDWRKIVESGLREGWYRIVFGEVASVDRLPTGGVRTLVRGQGGAELVLDARFVIDATGLDAKVKESPLLADLVDTYQLPLNPLGRLTVADDFEVPGLRATPGRFFAAGSMTLGGPFAPVDSFVGLQYAARLAVDALARAGAPGARRMGPLRSTAQWMKWVVGAAP